MNLILHIDTAVQGASVCLAEEGRIIDTDVSASEKDTASWLHPAIRAILQRNHFSASQLDAVAVSGGPGSYTGLRVGMSTAKGLCYALSVPLISINTLQMMAAAVPESSTDLLCPMIDARRMEVFTALYNTALQEVLPPSNLILEKSSFSDWLREHTITFFGNGSIKAADMIEHSNALFVPVTATAEHMVSLAITQFREHIFSELAYSEPYYGKDFHSSIPKRNH